MVAVVCLSVVAIVVGRWWQPPPRPAFDEVHRRLGSANPAGIRYELRTANGRSQFRIGEAIPIELRFSSSLPHTYGLDDWTYARGLRMEADRFEVEPQDGHADPLADYYGTGLFTWWGGGGHSRQALGPEPVSIAAYLNAWVRFDRPGRYKVFARSWRIRREVLMAGEPGSELVEVVSDVMELSITQPEPDWAQAEVDRLSRLVEDADGNVRLDAAERLRFLGTVPALKVMASGLTKGREDGESFTLGILGSRYRREAREILEAKLADPARPVDAAFLRLLAFVRIRPWLVVHFPMPYESQRLGTIAMWGYQHIWILYHRAFEFAVDEAGRDRAHAAPNSTPEAPRPMPLVRIPALVETMERLQRTDRTAFRERVLADLRRDSPELYPYLRLVTDLPDRTLPDLEEHFAARASHEPWFFGHLLARYGTRRVLPSVRATYAEGHLRWGCDSRFPFLAYFLRVAPSEGSALLRKALQEREGNGCYRSLLGEVAQIYPAQELEPIAIDFLDDPDSDVAMNAAAVLAGYGSASAEKYLWRRLERWAQRWRGRPRNLYGNPATGEGGQPGQLRLFGALQNAIMGGQSWYFDESRRQRLAELCVTDACREGFTKRQKAPPTVRVRVFRRMYSEPTYEVGAFMPGTLDRFRQKVAQFPRGTIFGWCTEREGGHGLSREDAALAFRDARGAVESQGFRLDPKPPNGSCLAD